MFCLNRKNLSKVGLNVYLSRSQKNDEALRFVDFTTKFDTVTRSLGYTLAMITGLSKILNKMQRKFKSNRYNINCCIEDTVLVNYFKSNLWPIFYTGLTDLDHIITRYR